MSPSRRLLSLAFAAMAAAASLDALADSIVHPTGRFPDDVSSVRQALALGGTVRLAPLDVNGNPAEFNFGPSIPGGGFATLAVDAQLVGEPTADHPVTIGGGFTPIRIATPTAAVRNIHFRAPGYAGIRVFSSRALEITGNAITDVVPLRSGPFTFAQGILSGTSAVQGTLLVSGNTISGVHADASYGISISNHTADTRITGNAVYGVDLNAILVGVNSAPVSIDHNLVVPGPGVTPDSAGNGILFGHTRGGPASISDNVIVCDNPFADGIAIVGLGTAPLEEHDAVIERNDVTMHGSLYGAISLYDQASDNFVRGNKVSGHGAYALQVGTFVPPGTAQANTFIGNNISHFAADVADIFLDVNSQGTIVKGNHGSVIDLGASNSISGSGRKSLDGNLGDRVRRAQALKRAITQAVPEIDP